MNHLILALEAPLMAFGGETVDNYGVVRWFPAASMLTGLLANALGWRRTEGARHQTLQDRLVFAARIDREPADGARLTDFQTAWLVKNEKGWTTLGQPEGRAGSVNTYDAPHLRYRDYLADMRLTVALRLQEDGSEPTTERLAEALQQPFRPLFIGRKPCLPSERLFQGFQDGATALAALLTTPLAESNRGAESVRVQWPEGEGVAEVRSNRTYMLTDQRNWISGLHGGGRSVCESTIPAERFAAAGNGNAQAEEERPV